MLFLYCKNLIKTTLSLAIALVFVVFSRALCVSRFSKIEGERTFYLYSASSQAVIKDRLRFADLFFVKGESVEFACEGEEESLQKLLDIYQAKIVFLEETDGVRSYYCATTKWSDGVFLEGEFVNLHIAFRDSRCVVGAPLIFGGF